MPRGRVLVSGFESFGTVTRNPSGEAARALDGQRVGEVDIVGVSLPVSWSRAWPLLEQAILTAQPAAVVLMGVAPSPFVRLEVLAMNAAFPEEDVDGQLPPRLSFLRLLEDAPPAYATLFALDELKRRLLTDSQLWGVPGTPDRVGVELFGGAGSYLCNYVYFQVLHAYRFRFPAFFAHVPPLEYCANPRALFSAEQLTRALQSLVLTSATMIHDAEAWTRDHPAVPRYGALPRLTLSVRRLLSRAQATAETLVRTELRARPPGER